MKIRVLLKDGMFCTVADSNRTNGCTVTCIAMERDRLRLLQPQTIMVYSKPQVGWDALREGRPAL